MDWINAFNKYFDFEEVEDKKKVRYAATKLKGLAAIWWDELHIHREGTGNPKLKYWDKMLYKIKSQFMPKDYQLTLIRQLHNLRQNGMTVKQYTKEFYKLIIRVGQTQGDVERVARYINGIRYEIQNEINFLNLKTVEDAYQVASRVEEKILRKQNQKSRGRNTTRGREFPNRGGRTPKGEVEGSSSQVTQRGGF